MHWSPRIRVSDWTRLGKHLAFAWCVAVGSFAAADEQEPVSFYQQIRPILQANCHGCHQPALDQGGYVMTEFERLQAGGESEMLAVAPGKPDESHLVELITPVDGEAEMPKGKPPLSEAEVSLIRRWIVAGAKDDTPAGARQEFDLEHPPIYTRPPAITSFDFSPDGALIAIAGFHEVLISDTNSSELVARLIGVSERIESVQFSPDGSRLMVTGGLPCRMGEVQVWNVAEQELELSVPVTYDTLYGGTWSPDGKLIAFGCSDNTLRAIDATTGQQVLFQGAHNDWVRDTVFSNDGSHLMSVGRDMTCKLTEVATERFVDNITSITPGVLKGGVNAVARHPSRDEIVVGGADGEAKVYRVFRLTARRIGDDANLIRRMPPMRGRIFDVAVNHAGTRFAAVSSLDGSGQLSVYSYEFQTDLPDDIKAIQSKTVQGRTAEEKADLVAYHTKDVQVVVDIKVPEAGLYAVRFSPDGRWVAAAGSDGRVRLFDVETGESVKDIAPAPIASKDTITPSFPAIGSAIVESTDPSPPPETELSKLVIRPPNIELKSDFDYAQLVVTGESKGGTPVDVTRLVTARLSSQIVEISANGFVTPLRAGDAMLVVEYSGLRSKIPVHVSGSENSFAADFVRDVNPVLSRVGCNLGTCHGSAKGKNGFKLSLRGYDPLFDTRALTDDLASRRTNLASPDDSLMLLKATGAVPHVGGQVVKPGEPYYRVIRQWIAGGAKLDRSTPRVTQIDVFPKNPVINEIGRKQQIRVVASYADGKMRDVTREAFLESGNTEIAAADRTGLMTALRRGEAPVLARYEGAYVATTLTVMGQRDEFVWRQPETWGPIDELVAAKWQRMKIQPADLCTDAEFIRRLYVDLIGLPPTSTDVRQFLADYRDPQIKRAELVDKLIGSEDFIEYWTNKWADLLQVNRKFLGAEGAATFRKWIRQEVAANTPYDEFARKILTANGSNKDNPAASYFKILRDPESLMENTTHLFLAVRFNCNKCHDHPFERWTQDQYYETAAYFARVGLKADPASGKRTIGGTAVEGAKPFYEVVFEQDDGEVTHNRTGALTKPVFPFDCEYEISEEANRREQLAAWITSPDNQYFAKSYVNRLWGYLFGVGIIEPIDDLRASNPASNPELIEFLTEEFVRNRFNPRHMLRQICKSRTYQLSIKSNRWNDDDTINYSHATARRLPAEVLYDAIHRVTGAESKIPGVPAGTRAAALPDSGVKLSDGFLVSLGRPARESACECERVNDLQLAPVMALIAGPTVASAIADMENGIAELVATEPNDARLVDELLMRIMNRPASATEVAAFIDILNGIEGDHQSLVESLEKREAWWTEHKPQQEQDRLTAIAQAKADLEAYQLKIAPRMEEEKQQQTERVAELQAEYDKYLEGTEQRVAEWEAKQPTASVEWHLLEAKKLEASGKIKLSKQVDRSIRAIGDEKKSTYTIHVETSLQNIRGIRLEFLPEKNQNFVLTELQVLAAKLSQPDSFTAVELGKALADHSQANLDVGFAIDGKTGGAQGWGVGPAADAVHWATFEVKEPVGSGEAVMLKFVLHHNRDNLNLRHFRLAVTTASSPIGLSLPESLKSVVSTPAAERDDEQKAILVSYVTKVDSKANDQERVIAEAKRPLPEDRGVTERKQALAAVSKDVSEDGLLRQLRQDVKYSQEQASNKRLTASQDLVWALINTPAFLFNR